MISKLVKSVLASRRWLWFVILANLVGFISGLMFYAYQLSITPKYLWLFVIDCPLYAFLAIFVLLGRDRKWNVPDWFVFIVTAGLFKYAIWTFYALSVYWKYFFFELAPVWNYTYAPAHILMFVEGFLIFSLVKRFKKSYILIAAGWFWLNDFIDYWLGTYPLIPAGHVLELRNLMIAVSIVIPVLVYIWRKHLKKWLDGRQHVLQSS